MKPAPPVTRTRRSISIALTLELIGGRKWFVGSIMTTTSHGEDSSGNPDKLCSILLAMILSGANPLQKVSINQRVFQVYHRALMGRRQQIAQSRWSKFSQ